MKTGKQLLAKAVQCHALEVDDFFLEDTANLAIDYRYDAVFMCTYTYTHSRAHP